MKGVAGFPGEFAYPPTELTMTAMATSTSVYDTVASIRPEGEIPLAHSFSVTINGNEVDSGVGVKDGSSTQNAGYGRLRSGFGSVPFVSTNSVLLVISTSVLVVISTSALLVTATIVAGPKSVDSVGLGAAGRQ